VENLILVLALGIGISYFLISIITLKYPPKKINHWYGYRTNRSRKSKESWDFAQAFASSQMKIWGALITMMAPLSYSFEFSETLGAIIITIMAITPIALTEWALKKKFDD
jgi:uncharacterized membrane protein